MIEEKVSALARNERWHVKVMACHDGASVSERSRIGNRGAGADHRRVVSRHIGNGDGNKRRGERVLCKPSAFDA